jgi:hypothetical protein
MTCLASGCVARATEESFCFEHASRVHPTLMLVEFMANDRILNLFQSGHISVEPLCELIFEYINLTDEETFKLCNPPFVMTQNFCQAIGCWDYECIHQHKSINDHTRRMTRTMTGWCLKHASLGCSCKMRTRKYCSSCEGASLMWAKYKP